MADGNLASYYGAYNGTGYNVTYVKDSQAGYAALTCSEVIRLLSSTAQHAILTCLREYARELSYLRLRKSLCAHGS